jgi:hypothetical protein
VRFGFAATLGKLRLRGFPVTQRLQKPLRNVVCSLSAEPVWPPK